MKRLKFGKRKHRGALVDSLATTRMISQKEFFDLLPHYHYYAYDRRCSQVIFIANGFEYAEWHWLFIQL